MLPGLRTRTPKTLINPSANQVHVKLPDGTGRLFRYDHLLIGIEQGGQQVHRLEPLMAAFLRQFLSLLDRLLALDRQLFESECHGKSGPSAAIEKMDSRLGIGHAYYASSFLKFGLFW